MNKNPKVDQPQTNQIKQLNFKVSPDFYWQLKNTASTKRCKMGELFEKAFQFYQKREPIINELNAYRQNIQTIEQQMQTFQGGMSWLELKAKVNSLSSAPFNKIGLIITHQILKETLEQILELTSNNPASHIP